MNEMKGNVKKVMKGNVKGNEMLNVDDIIILNNIKNHIL